jgi:electron transfer flavoprotein alpha subunit
MDGALVLVEAGDELSLQALAFARVWGEPAALTIGADPGPLPIATVHVAEHESLEGGFAPDGWAASVLELAGLLGPRAIVAAGTERGNDVMARVAARAGAPLAANCTQAEPTSDGATVTRIRWGGSLLETAALRGSPTLLTVAPHAVAAEGAVGTPRVERFTPQLADSDLRVQAVERLAAGGGGISLSDARIVVSGGRGVGSAEGFAPIEELAGLLGAAVGCSRAVTMAGWRPHKDQVGQTGTKIAPDIYIACGISGATQHMAGCKGAKRLLAINPDREAPILASADYAVIGDLHEVVPAISSAILAARGAA